MDNNTKQTLLQMFKILAYILTGLLCCTAIVGAYACYIPPTEWGVPSVLVLVFVPMAILLIVLAAVWLICKQWITGIVVILCLLLCAPAWQANFPLHINEAQPQKDEKVLTLLTYNIFNMQNDRNSGEKLSPTLSYIIASGADVVCLQEAYSLNGPMAKAFPEQSDSLLKLYPYRVDYGNNELMTLSKFPIHSYRDRDGMESTKTDTRLADLMEIDYYGMPILLVNVHLTSYGLSQEERDLLRDVKGTCRRSAPIIDKLEDSFILRARLVEQIKQKIKALHVRDVIICGDFNDVPGSYAYHLMMGDDMKDAYVETGFGPMVTFNAWHLYFHIDQVMYCGDNMRALSCKRGNLRSSDHFPVITRFAVSLP